MLHVVQCKVETWVHRGVWLCNQLWASSRLANLIKQSKSYFFTSVQNCALQFQHALLKMPQTGKWNVSALVTSVCVCLCVFVCVRTPLSPLATLFVLYPLSVFCSPFFVAASFRTYMSSCFTEIRQWSTFSHKRALFNRRLFAAAEAATTHGWTPHFRLILTNKVRMFFCFHVVRRAASNICHTGC